MTKVLISVFLILCITCTDNAFSQEPLENITNKEKKIVVDSISKILQKNYVFPKVANSMVEMLAKNSKSKLYNTITDGNNFADRLTKDLRAISHDLHLKVIYDPNSKQRKNITREDSLKIEQSKIEKMRRGNFGFKEIKILNGNIGYLDLRKFENTNYAGETAVAAMNFLSNVDALIIDLRNNGGGWPNMIQLLASYFFTNEPVLLNSFYFRPTQENSESWTQPYVPGKTMHNVDLYILTSKKTFSAAEGFSYNLKNLKRATIIGEQTGGGAHTGKILNVTDKFKMWTPRGRAINPITKKNWEGTGVTPDIEVPSNQALGIAQTKAIEVLLEKSKDTKLKKFYKWTLKGLKALLEPVLIETATLQSYTGSYAGTRVVSIENNSLYYQRDNGTKYKLTPLNQEEFLLIGKNSFRIRFFVKNGKTVELEIYHDNGRSNKYLMNKK